MSGLCIVTCEYNIRLYKAKRKNVVELLLTDSLKVIWCSFYVYLNNVNICSKQLINGSRVLNVSHVKWTYQEIVSFVFSNVFNARI